MLTRGKPRRTGLAERLERDLWRDNLGPCASRDVTACEGKVRGHHIVPQQTLRKAGLELALWDKRNRLALCDRHHTRHHSRLEPVSRDALPQCALDFAAEHGLERHLERFYPLPEPGQTTR